VCDGVTDGLLEEQQGKLVGFMKDDENMVITAVTYNLRIK